MKYINTINNFYKLLWLITSLGSEYYILIRILELLDILNS